MIEWRNAQPYSTTYQDIYFSTEDGIAETEYVFIAGNQLEARWQAFNKPSFTIIETGFGTGLNFLCVCQKWLSFLQALAQNALPQLNYISVEKHPLSLADITAAMAFFPSLKYQTDAFLAQYISALETQTPVSLFNQNIQLTLLQGDATQSLSQVSTKADAWFLDGFAPSKNPDMWQSALFAEMARLSAPETTFATFTSAGIVKRGLTSAGFKVNKQAGFGKKREMLTGAYVGQEIEG